MSINIVSLQGRICNIDNRVTKTGKPVCTFTMAVDRIGKAGSEKVTDFISCVAFNNKAEFISKYFHKGSLISLTGSIRTGSYEKDGQTIRKVEINVNDVSFCGYTKSDIENGLASSSAPRSGSTPRQQAPRQQAPTQRQQAPAQQNYGYDNYAYPEYPDYYKEDRPY